MHDGEASFEGIFKNVAIKIVFKQSLKMQISPFEG